MILEFQNQFGPGFISVLRSVIWFLFILLSKILDKIFTLIMSLNIKIPPYECKNWFPNVIIIYVYNISTHRDSALQLIITKFWFIVPNDVLILYSSLCPYSPVIYIKIGKAHEIIYVNCVYMVEILYTASFPDCFQWHHIGNLKSVIEVVFTPQKSATASDRGYFLLSLPFFLSFPFSLPSFLLLLPSFLPSCAGNLVGKYLPTNH